MQAGLGRTDHGAGEGGGEEECTEREAGDVLHEGSLIVVGDLLRSRERDPIAPSYTIVSSVNDQALRCMRRSGNGRISALRGGSGLVGPLGQLPMYLKSTFSAISLILPLDWHAPDSGLADLPLYAVRSGARSSPATCAGPGHYGLDGAILKTWGVTDALTNWKKA